MHRNHEEWSGVELVTSTANNSGLRDNHTRGTVADFLKAEIQVGSRLSVVSAYFTIYAYDALKDYLDRIDHLDFLFGEPSFVNRLDPSKTEKKAFLIDTDGLSLPTSSSKSASPKNAPTGSKRKVDIKTDQAIQPAPRQDVSRGNGRSRRGHSWEFQFHRARPRPGRRRQQHRAEPHRR